MKASALTAPTVLFPHQPGRFTHSRLSKRCTEPWFLITPRSSLSSHSSLKLRKTWESQGLFSFSATSPKATDVKAHVVNETGRDLTDRLLNRHSVSSCLFFFFSFRSKYLLEHLRVDKMAWREQTCVRTFTHWDFLPVSLFFPLVLCFPSSVSPPFR